MALDINFPTASQSKDSSTLSQLGPERPSFDFKGTCYPLDLFDENSQYGNNYMVFYINVHEDSQFAKNAMDESERVAAGLAPALRDNMAGLSSDAIKRAVGVEGGLAGGAATTQLAKYIEGAGQNAPVVGLGNNRGGQLLDDFIQYTTKGAGYVGGYALATSLISKKAAYKTSRQAIALYIPEVKTTYTTNWGEASTAMSQALAKGLESTNWSGTVDASSLLAAGEQAFNNVTAAAKGYIASTVLQNNAFASKAGGLAGNPKKEQLFKEVSFRQHQFTYNFSPRSPAEAKAVIQIIKAFKFHMHPEFKSGFEQWLYIYPSEFDIYYYNKGVVNQFLPKYTSCALTNMSVMYSDGQNGFLTFDDVNMGEVINGMPVNISMGLTFQELAVLSKETIDQGF